MAMQAYRLSLLQEPATAGVSFEFEAETDRDAVRLGAEAAAGLGGLLWREGRLLLRLEKFGVDQATPAWSEAD
ncbi:MAG TPA: hypothetical protein VJS38_13910 [Phenylobacterium sp.]|uniref:hypothetical protein n=1 Tax=Phenylobacterium sp. TaxID=1871053 RepID=UPI002B4784D4|nr:hypothetical protein [Phenylobacterium sp.]HKR89260.1 hypothetical protein [Phenylobacterium sp.]